MINLWKWRIMTDDEFYELVVAYQKEAVELNPNLNRPQLICTTKCQQKACKYAKWPKQTRKGKV